MQLVAGDRFQVRTKYRRVIQTDGGQDRQVGVPGIGGVVPAAEPHLEERIRGPGGGRGFEWVPDETVLSYLDTKPGLAPECETVPSEESRNQPKP